MATVFYTGQSGPAAVKLLNDLWDLAASGGGGGSGAAWGAITGEIDSQSDLKGALDAKQNTSGIAEVIDDRVAALLIPGAGVTLTYNDTANTLTVAAVIPGMSWNTQTSSYTLVLADAGNAICMNASGANNLTVPPHSDVAFPTGTSILVRQKGAGLTTMVQGAGVTIEIRSPRTLVSAGQKAVWTLVQSETVDTWILAGDLA